MSPKGEFHDFLEQIITGRIVFVVTYGPIFLYLFWQAVVTLQPHGLG